MNKQFLGILFLIALPLAGTGLASAAEPMDCIQGSGVARQEERRLPAFTALEVNGVFDVHLSTGTPRQVKLSGDDNILPLIRTEVQNGTLRVESIRSICIKTDLKLEIIVPAIERVAVDGTVSLRAEKLHGDSFALTLDGSSNATIGGECRRFEADLNGAAALEAEALRTRHASVRITGTGEATVYASERLDARISGVGTVTYAGNPAQINPEITGLGELIAR